MFKEKIKKNSEKLFKNGKTNKKNIENLVVLLALLIITLIAIKQIWGDKKTTENDNNIENSYKVLAEDTKEIYEKSNIPQNTEYNLEEKLEDILCNIDGVGTVKVLVTYSESSEKVAMHNQKQTTSITEETDAEGGKRVVESTDTSKEVVFENGGNSNTAIIEKIIMPKVEGAIVIASGAGNASIKADIIQAVSAVTGIATYKIQVFKME